jgi:hypothetical protein
MKATNNQEWNEEQRRKIPPTSPKCSGYGGKYRPIPFGITHCACGRPLHYTNQFIRRIIEGLIDCFGAETTVEGPKGTYSVQRHYIALHGISESELESLADQGIIRRVLKKKIE